MPIPRSAPAMRLPPGARRAALLAALEEQGAPTTVGELAEVTGLHPNTVRAHLEVLVREGRASRRADQRGARGRPRELYEASGAPDPAQAYAALALLLAEQLAAATGDPAAEGEDMGRRWAARSTTASQSPNRAPTPAPAPPSSRGTSSRGTTSGPTAGATSGTAPGVTPGPTPADQGVAHVVRVLRRAGFAPEVSADGDRVLLHSCPIRDVAHAQPAVVCQAHLGLIRATLEAAGSTVVATGIQPFVEPHLCVATLGDRTTTDDAGLIPG